MIRYRAAKDLDALRRLTARQQETRARVLEAVSESRRTGAALSRTAREAGTTLRSVRQYAAPAVERLPGGRYRVKPSDRLYRRIQVISTEGPAWVDTWSSREAQLASDHANAVRGVGSLGRDAEALVGFAGRTVGGTELETDVLALGAMAAAGDLDEFDLYDETAA